jgi:hypothetical protein
MPEEIIAYYKQKVDKANDAFITKLRKEGEVNVMSNPLEVDGNIQFNFW